jgi:hypothetical protein
MTSILARIGTLATGHGLSGTTRNSPSTYRGHELPPFTVESRHGAAELRAYAPHLLAEVTIPGDRESALQTGFSTLARFIFGANDGGARVAMTAPVSQRKGAAIAMTAPVAQAGGQDGWTVSFTMPSSFTRQSLPRPDDPAIRIVETEPLRRLVLGFSGRATRDRLNARADDLRRIAAQAGIALDGGPEFLFYDDPFTLPWNRRNEVAFTLQ